jgi:hypothetical protein
MKKIFFALLILLGCNPNSYEDFHCEGDAHCRKMLDTLKKIQDRQQLLQAQPVLKQHFEELVNLMIAARKFQMNSLETKIFYPSTYSESVIEGGREVIEKAQKQAFLRLSEWERQIGKKQSKVRSELIQN